MSYLSNPPQRRIDQSFLDRAKRIASFRAEHHRLPSGRSKDTEERILGRWLNNLRTTLRGNTGKGPQLNPERIATLDELLPGWSSVEPGNHADDELFRARVDQVASFVEENGRMPRSSSTECDGLGAWLTRVRSAARGKSNMAWSPEREQMISQAFPGWLHGDDE